MEKDVRTGCFGEYLGLREREKQDMKKQHNEQLRYLYCSRNTGVIK